VSFVRDTAQGHLENVSARRFLRWLHGIPPDATTVWVAAAPPGGPDQGRRGRSRGRAPEIHPVRIFSLTPDLAAREIRSWSRFPQWFLYGHASALTWVARQVDRLNGPLPKPPVCAVSTSDMLTEHAADRIAQAFGVPVHSWYGSNEMNGFVAGTLPGTRRYAINPLLVYPEVLDEDGRPARPGETGRLILTDLNNLVMPFIRYETGDLAVASDDTVGGFRVVDDLAGRDSEVLRLPSGRIVSGATLGAALFVTRDFVDDVGAYQCAKVGPNELELRVVWDRPVSEERQAAVVDAVRSVVDPDTVVRARSLDLLDRWPSGKAWIVRDETASPDRT
jgi:phenylacetate-CoA ligase